MIQRFPRGRVEPHRPRLEVQHDGVQQRRQEVAPFVWRVLRGDFPAEDLHQLPSFRRLVVTHILNAPATEPHVFGHSQARLVEDVPRVNKAFRRRIWGNPFAPAHVIRFSQYLCRDELFLDPLFDRVFPLKAVFAAAKISTLMRRNGFKFW